MRDRVALIARRAALGCVSFACKLSVSVPPMHAASTAAPCCGMAHVPVVDKTSASQWSWSLESGFATGSAFIHIGSAVDAGDGVRCTGGPAVGHQVCKPSDARRVRSGCCHTGGVLMINTVVPRPSFLGSSARQLGSCLLGTASRWRSIERLSHTRHRNEDTPCNPTVTPPGVVVVPPTTLATLAGGHH